MTQRAAATAHRKPGTRHALAGVAGLALLAVVAWWLWLRDIGPVPPEVRPAEDEAALAEYLRQARNTVVAKPRSAEAWGDYGRALRVADFKAEARMCFERAARLDSSEPRWPYLAGESLLPADPEAALPLLMRGAELARTADPNNPAPQLRLAEVYLALGRYAEAESHLRRVLEIDPTHAAANLALGMVAHNRDDPTAAANHFSRCSANAITRKRATSRLAALRRQEGQVAEAERLSREAEQLPPDLPWPDPYLIEARRHAAGRSSQFQQIEQLEAAGRHKDAVVMLGEIVERTPDARAFVSLGRNLTRLGDFDAAEQALRMALQLKPDLAHASVHLAEVYWARGEHALQQGDTAGARKYYASAVDQASAALRANPHDGSAHLLAGVALSALGRRDEAIKALRDAALSSPDRVEPLFRLGEALAEAGQIDEARRKLEEAVRIGGPDDPRPKKALERLGDREKK
jgi:tetratricopeptide (TPR) repeat protein